MKTLLIACLITFAIVGCRGPDQEPYSRAILWENASVVNQSETNAYRFLELESGTNLVLELTDGYYHGKRTTAHSTHDSVYLVLKRPPERGDYLTFSFADGTLDYDGFWGYGFNVLDTNRAAVADLRVWDASATRLDADVQVSLWHRADSLGGGTEVPPSCLFVVKGRIEIERKRK